MDTIVALTHIPDEQGNLDITAYSKSVPANQVIISHAMIMEEAILEGVEAGTYILWLWTDSICSSCHSPVGYETGLGGVYTVTEERDYYWGFPDSNPAPTKVVTWPPKASKQ